MLNISQFQWNEKKMWYHILTVVKIKGIVKKLDE